MSHLRERLTQKPHHTNVVLRCLSFALNNCRNFHESIGLFYAFQINLKLLFMKQLIIFLLFTVKCWLKVPNNKQMGNN